MSTTEDMTYSTTEVCRLTGITYRMIDYYERNGYITIEDPACGSGSRRSFTPAEVQALVRVQHRLAEAQSILDAFRSGDLWAEELRSAR